MSVFHFITSAKPHKCMSYKPSFIPSSPVTPILITVEEAAWSGHSV